MRSALKGLAANITLLQKLSPETQNKFTEMAKNYAKSGSYTQLKKLFKNALRYVAEGRVAQTDSHCLLIKGNSDEHIVTNLEKWSCDCDLFNGINNYEGHPGECSHIQAAKLSTKA